MALPKFVKKLFLFPLLIIVLLVLNSFIDPFKTVLDPIREDMNCPNTRTFNQTAWDGMSKYEHMSTSTECYGLNFVPLLFVGLLSILAFWGWSTK